MVVETGAIVEAACSEDDGGLRHGVQFLWIYLLSDGGGWCDLTLAQKMRKEGAREFSSGWRRFEDSVPSLPCSLAPCSLLPAPCS